ncbi:hypothetical protein AABB24_025141 [Solanum stoloniferum]|uniref:Uncharacterized protein n=1 Tax=Solanum stoloniferum TaxID=62892 RepID=A0ABD2SRT2_9SOLN
MPSYMENLFLRHPISCLKWWRPLRTQLEKLIKEAGAETVNVSGILPIGCFLGYRTEGDSIGKCRCRKGLNMYSKLHNDHLWQAIRELRLKYPDVHIIYADYYKAFTAILKKHTFLGFYTKNLMKACCGRGDGPLNFGFRPTPDALENLINTLLSQKVFIFPEFKFGEETTAQQ